MSVFFKVKGFKSLGFLNLYGSNCASKINSFGKLFLLEAVRNKISGQKKSIHIAHSGLMILDKNQNYLTLENSKKSIKKSYIRLCNANCI